MTLKEFLGLVRLYWKTFAAGTTAVLALGAAWLLLSPLQYVSTAQLLVSVNGTTTANAYQNDDVVAARVNSYVALLGSQAVSQRVVDKLRLTMSPEALAAKVSAVQVPPNTAIIDIAATDPSPSQARRIADTVATEFVFYADALESPTGEDAQKVKATVVSPATQPQSRRIERIVIAGLIGLLALLAGAVAVWIRAMTDTVVRAARQAAAGTGLPVLAVVSPGEATSLEALEPYRRVNASLRHHPGPVVEISAADGTPDVAQLAANLGRATAFAGHRCAVVDAADWETDSPAEAATAVSASLDPLRKEHQQIIVAAGPVVSDPVASALSEQADAVVLAVPLGTARRAEIRRAAANLAGLDAKVAGVLAVK